MTSGVGESTVILHSPPNCPLSGHGFGEDKNIAVLGIS